MKTGEIAVTVVVTLVVLAIITQAPVVKDYGQFVVGGSFGK